ncbi:MFS transporter [Paenibacillus glycinis]|uniref:MFS transporter n=1 Tax=Paenibacillus glycinis TaxID=2697035 RepID=UPI001F401CCC|nr:MFS transporter [Paenibacillus glycinis]
MLASFVGGYWADRIGRKPVLAIGECLNTFAFLGMLLANSLWWSSAWVTFAMLLLIGIATGLINPAADAMLIDVSTKETRTYMYSINYWTRNFSLMLGLMVGGWFFQNHLFGLLFVLFSMSLITLTITLLFIRETYDRHHPVTVPASNGLHAVLSSYRTVVRDIPFVWFTLGGIAIYALEFQRVNFISIRMEHEIAARTVRLFDFPPFTLDGVKLLSLLTVENTLLIVLFVSFAAKLIRNRSEQPVMYVRFTLFGLGYSYLAFSNQIAGLFLAVIVLTIGELLYVPTRQTMLASMVDESKRGSYMAFNGLVVQAGKMFGALGIFVGGLVGDIGMGLLYLLFAIMAIGLSRLGYVKWNRQTKAMKMPTSIIKS